MPKIMFLIRGNICCEQIRIARALHKPPLTQEDLARQVNLRGMKMTPLMISRIENNQRHICDAELRVLAKTLGVSMEWICGDDE